MPYTYLGRLAYVTHDADPERPAHFQWQLVDDWPPPNDFLARVGLELTPPTPPTPPPSRGLVETPALAGRRRTGTTTATFRTHRFSDRAAQDARNRQLGLAGERAVVAREREWLGANGRQDLADAVRHVAALEGDGAGYDVASFELDGSERFIEVKTTRGGPETDFFISANDLEFSTRHPQSYVLCRLYSFDPDTEAGNFYVRRGALTQDVSLQLQPVQFRVRVVEPE